MIDVAVVGCGAMGTHHARIVAADRRCRLVATVDVLPERADDLATRFGGEGRAVVPQGVEAVIIATPTTTHRDIVAEQLRAGRWVLAEKPLVANAEAALGLPADRLAIGHVERFNPAVRAIGAVQPTAVVAWRRVPPTTRNRDIDAALDVLIHDLDLVLMWAGQGQPELIDARSGADEASCTVRIGDLTAQLTASRCASESERRAELRTAGGRIALDFLSGQAVRDGTAVVATDDRDGLTAQWDAFVDAVTGRGPIAVGLVDAARAVALAEQVSRASLPTL